MGFISYSILFFCFLVKLTEGGGLLTINFDSFTHASEDLSDYCYNDQNFCNIKATFCVRFGESTEYFDCSSHGIVTNTSLYVHYDGHRYLLTYNNEVRINTTFGFNGTFEIYSEITTYSPGEGRSLYDIGYLRTRIASLSSPRIGIIQGLREFDEVFVNLSYALDCSPGFAGAVCNSESNNSSSSQPNNGISLSIISPPDQSIIHINLTSLSYKLVHCLVQGDPTEVYWLDENLDYVSDDRTLFLNIETIQHIVGAKPYYCYAAKDNELIFVTIWVVIAGTQRGRRDILEDFREGLMGDVDNEFDSDIFDSFNDYLLSITGDLNSELTNSNGGSYDFSDEDYEVLDEVSSTYDTLVHQFTQRYNVLQQRNVTQNLLNTANRILRLSTRPNNQTQEKNLRSVARATSMAYTSLEYISLSIADNLEYLDSSETYSVAYDSIYIYGRSWDITELGDKENIRVPESTEGEQVEIPIELVNQFRMDRNKFSVATTVVNTHDYYGFQETETNTSQVASRTVQIVVPSNYSTTNSTVFLKPYIKISFNVTSFANSTSNFTCVFLNSTSVEWSTTGVYNGNTTNATIDCYTTHLTNFAVLISPNILESIGTPNYLATTIVSYCLGIISFVLLTISLILFLAAGKEFFKKESNIVYFNCGLAMFLAMGLYVFASDTFTFNLALCKAVAFLLHYTWLAMFAWMFCVGLLLLHTIILGSKKKHKIYPWLFIIGWICPVIIPIITFGVGYNYYIDDEPRYCVLGGNLVYAFFVPVYTVIMFNFIIFCFTLVKIFYAMKRTSNIKNSEIRKKTIITGFTLTPILGLPWGFNIIGHFYQHPAISWVHVVLTGSLGITFFFIVVVLNEEVQGLFCRSRRLRRRTLKSRVSVSKKSGTVIQRPRARTVKSTATDDNSLTMGSISKVSETGEVHSNSSELEKNIEFLESSSSPTVICENAFQSIVIV